MRIRRKKGECKMNAVVLAVLVMLVLSAARVHVVLSLVIGAFVGGLAAGLPLADVTNPATHEVVTKGVITHFQSGLAGGAKIALSYAMLGAFAMAIAHSGLPYQLAGMVVRKMGGNARRDQIPSGVNGLKWGLIGALLLMSIMSQNIIPIHIAFIPMVVPPLLLVFNRMQIDRRLLACVITFGLVTTYMFLPYGFGAIFLNQILLANIQKAGMNVQGVNVMEAMAIPAAGMLVGLLLAFIHYRKPRHYTNNQVDLSSEQAAANAPKISTYRSVVAVVAIVASFVVQLVYDDALLLGAMVGFGVVMATGVVRRREVDVVFDSGLRMMAMIGFIMIAAQGFAEVMQATGQIKPLVDTSASLFAGNKSMAALVMLAVGLLVTMGIGSSFSTLPIIASIYVPLCASMGFSPLATVAIIGTAGALGDAGSPASDSTLGPTSGLNVDGQHDHIYDSVIPTFIHYNLPLMAAGWVAAMVL